MRSSILRAARKFEAFIGAASAGLFGLVLLGLGMCLLFSGQVFVSDKLGPWIVVSALGVLVLEAAFLHTLSIRLKHGWLPFAPAFALSMRRKPLILRPVAAVWWTAHFLLGAFVAVLIESAFAAFGAFEHALLVNAIVFFAINFTLAYASNLYAMLALTALGCGERTIGFAWRWRGVLDLLAAAAAAFLAFEKWL